MGGSNLLGRMGYFDRCLGGLKIGTHASPPRFTSALGDKARHRTSAPQHQQRAKPFETWAPVASWTPSTPAAARTGTRWASPWASGSPRSSGAGCGRTSCSGSSCCRSRRRRRRSHCSPRSSPPTGRGTRGTGTRWWAPPTAAGSRSSTYVQRRTPLPSMAVSVCPPPAFLPLTASWSGLLLPSVRAGHPGQLQEGGPALHPEGPEGGR